MTELEEINEEYERQHLENIEKTSRWLQRYYLALLSAIVPMYAAGAPKAVIQRLLEKLMKELVRDVTGRMETGMIRSWSISRNRTRRIFEVQYSGMLLPKLIAAALIARRLQARAQFIQQRRDGLDLSDRVWKTAKQYRKMIEREMDKGISEGISAAKVAQNLRKALLSPNTQTAPGKGVYKSPMKNAQRLGRTQINSAYRMADHDAWKDNPLVLGYAIKLSASGKPKIRCELCRTLEGRYPASFVWSGWHPNCLCFKIPILMSREMLEAYNKLIARGEDTYESIAKLQAGVRVVQLPDAAAAFLLSSKTG